MSRVFGYLLLSVTILVAAGATFFSNSPKHHTDSAPMNGRATPAPIAQAESIAKLDDTTYVPASHTRRDPYAVCFAEGTPQEYIEAIQASLPQNSLAIPPDPNDPSPRYQFNDGDRWSGGQGNPRALTWSFVPDGLSVDGGTSSLFSRMDSLFASQGGRATWILRFQQCFNRWGEMTGTSYTRITFGGNDWDDGASFGSGGSANRGDIRIAAIVQDGVNGTLAYNYFPSNGDMVLDRDEPWNSQQTQLNRFLRNTVMHEHGHGLGFQHVCPVNSSILMEPFLNTGFDGIQHDDLRVGQRAYGDIYENNDTAATAIDRGTITQVTPQTTMCNAPPPTNGAAPSINVFTTCSIDSNGDVDFYKFTATASVDASVTVTPRGISSYASNPQNANCTGTNTVNSLAMADLNVQIIAADGTTVIATGASSPAGSAETLSGVPVSGTPGVFFVKVYEGNAPTESQLYTLSISVTNTGADLASPQPNPSTFEEPPHGLSTTQVSMTATTATDVTPPIEYQFEFIVGSTGGGPSGIFQSSPVFVDSDLAPNRAYTYTVRTRDNASPSINTGSYSAQATGYTLIQTPTGITFGAVTDNSIGVTAAGSFAFLTSLDSGIYLDSTTVGGDTGINEWIQVVSSTATALQPNTLYDFRAKARNRVAEETPYGPSASKATLALAPDAPVLSNATSNSMQVDVSPGVNPGYTELAIQCTGTNPFDANWQGKYVDASGNPQAGATWQDDPTWGITTVLGLQINTEYTFAVKARNLDSIETAFGPSDSLSTTSTPIDDCNENEVDDAIEIANNPSLDCDENGILDECQGAIDPPAFSQQPASEAVCSGQTATYTVVATGIPPLSYQWRIGTTPLNNGPTGNGSTITGADTDTLQINNAAAADAAINYNCLVTDNCASTPSDDVSLTVYASGSGDVNGDTQIDGLDVQSFVDAALSGGPASAAYCAADMNADGTVDDLDIPLLVAALVGP